MKIREELGQLSWFVKRYPPRRLRRQWQVTHRIQGLKLPIHRRNLGEVWAVSVVRDELDILPATVQHLLDQGVDNVLIADNQSQDGTAEYLDEISSIDPRIHWARDLEPAHFQSEKITWLAHLAWRAGADWILPFDADEFWFARGEKIVDYLRRQTACVVHADFHHMVPTQPTSPVILGSETVFTMDATPSFPGKVAARSHPLLEIIPGNHGASRVGRQESGLFIAHAQYRSPSQVARKIRQGAAAARLTGEDLSWFSPHWEKGSHMADDAIAQVWRNISQGRPDPNIDYLAKGPMVEVRPLSWSYWDPDGLVRRREV